MQIGEDGTIDNCEGKFKCRALSCGRLLQDRPALHPSMSSGIHIANSPSDQGPDQNKDPIREILNRGEPKKIPVLENRFCGRRFVACPPSPPRKKRPGQL